jgi:protein-L-isoaspartate(D-aspartate) O-methyltransferase
VGTGSGYAAAVLSRLCTRVISIERFESLAGGAVEVLAELGYANVEVRVGDGALGAPESSPFGGISVTATAKERPPQALFDQLGEGAALVCPVVRGRREELVRFRDGEEEAVASVRFVPLVSET